MGNDYRIESQRLEQDFADAYAAYRKHIESTPYPSNEDDWAEHDRYRNAVTAVTAASAAWGRYCFDNQHLR